MFNQMNTRTRIEKQDSHIHTFVKLTFVALLALSLALATAMNAEAHTEMVAGGSAAFADEVDNMGRTRLADEPWGGGATAFAFENEAGGTAQAKLFGWDGGLALFAEEYDGGGISASVDTPQGSAAEAWVPIVDYVPSESDIEAPDSARGQAAIEDGEAGDIDGHVEGQPDGNPQSAEDAPEGGSAQFADSDMNGGRGEAHVEGPEGAGLAADIESPDTGSGSADWQQELPEALQGEVALVTYVLLYLIK